MLTGLSRILISSSVVMLLAAQASARQQWLSASELAATYAVAHRYGGSSLTLEADGRYSDESGDCTTEYFGSGTYVLADGVLRLSILKQTAKRRGVGGEVNLLDPDARKETFGDAGGEIRREFTLLPVSWGERVYLIGEDALKDFANAINLGLEPRSGLISEPYYGSFYLRRGDEQKTAGGRPSLPDGWHSFLLDRPVTGTILVIEGDARERTAKINKGAREGLKAGMRLLAKGEEPSLWSGAEVISVEEDSARVRVGPGPKVGDRLTTKYERRDVYR